MISKYCNREGERWAEAWRREWLLPNGWKVGARASRARRQHTNRIPRKTLQCNSGASGGEGYGLLLAVGRECQGQTVDGVVATVAGIPPNYYQSKNSAARAPTSSSPPAFQVSTTSGASSRRTLPPCSSQGWRWSPCWPGNRRSRWWSALLVRWPGAGRVGKGVAGW